MKCFKETKKIHRTQNLKIQRETKEERQLELDDTYQEQQIIHQWQPTQNRSRKKQMKQKH